MILKTGLKKGSGVVFGALVTLWMAVTAAPAGQRNDSRPLFCDPALAALFTPRVPRLGRYQACADPRPLTEAAPRDLRVEALEALDALGHAGAYDRPRVARLYGGSRARVARQWTRDQGGFRATTFISPYPDPSLTRLEPGTLVIRWICDGSHAECKMPNVR